MSLNFNGNNISGMQYNGVTIGEAMMNGQIVYRSIIKLTGTSGMTSRNQLRDAVAARGLDYRTVTHLPFKIDTSEATSLLDLFNGWRALVVAPEMDTLQVTDMGGLFRGCTALEYVGDLQTSNVTNAGFMFDACPALMDGNVRLLGRNPNVSTTAMIANSGLTREPWYSADGLALVITATAPQEATLQIREELTRRGLNYLTIEKLPFGIDTSEATNLSWMFGDFLALKEVPAMDTSNVTDMSAMFWSCNALTAIPDLNTSKVTVANNMFQNCVSLTDGNVRLIGRHPSVDTTGMLTNSALTRQPWFNTDGTVWRVEQSADYYYPLDYTTDALANHGTKTTRLGFDSGSFANRTKHAYVNKATSRINVTEPWNGTFTLAGWFGNTGSTSAIEYLFARGSASIGTAFYFAARSTDKTQFLMRIDDGSSLSGWVYSPTGLIPTSGWFHLAVTFEIMSGRNYTRIYLNGTEVHATHWSSTYSPLSFASSDWASAGNFATGTSYPWEGDIDDIAVWSRTLSASEVQAVYAVGRSA